MATYMDGMDDGKHNSDNIEVSIHKNDRQYIRPQNIGFNQWYDYAGKWTIVELEEMISTAEKDCEYYDEKIVEFENLLYSAEKQHDMALWLLNNDLWIEEYKDVLQQRKETEQ